ncbi:recombinase family protein [Peribacillus frigoritolerans]|uniref:recombinase family protein n=1 Tax=Peribacillus frigoritolerans TaxID=450367 RepID=UPI001070CFA1|nr:recombinase family protein [Peribacillus frigoritolerans]TFH63490.1 hypothetical protein E4J71_07005 [Peribacillus frigoritolerans]
MAVRKSAKKVKTGRVAIYIRSSREREGGEDETLFTQRKILTDIAKNKGYSYDIYEEIESSVKEDRDELGKMKNKLVSCEYDRILVTKLDRLARDTGIFTDIKKICIKNGILIETTTEEIDLTKKTDKMMYNFKSLIAESEYDEIKDRLLTGKFNTVAKRNRWMGSVAPLGYRWDRNVKQLIVVPEEKEIIRKMVELALQGYSSRQIASKLNAMGYRGKKGSPFKTDRVLRILSNKAYLGMCEYYSSYLNETAIAKDCHEPIMTVQEYNDIQALIKSRVSKENLSSLGVKSPVNKILKCGVCGKGLTIQLNNKVRKSGKNYSFYQIRPCLHYLDDLNTVRCNNAGVRVSVIEEAVIEYLKQHKPEIEASIQKLESKDTSELENQLMDTIETVKSNISKYQRRLDKAYEAYLDDLITKEKYSKDSETFGQIINELEDELVLLRNKLSNLDTDAQKEKYMDAVEIIEKYELMSMEEQNASLRLLIKEIVYTRTNETNNVPHVTIIWREL